AAGHRDRGMVRQLKAPQPDQRNEVSHMQAVGARVEAGIEGCWFGQAQVQSVALGATGNQFAPLQLLENMHRNYSRNSPGGRRFFSALQPWEITFRPHPRPSPPGEAEAFPIVGKDQW